MDKAQQANKKKAETEALPKRYDSLLKCKAMLQRDEEKTVENLAERIKDMKLKSQKRVRFAE